MNVTYLRNIVLALTIVACGSNPAASEVKSSVKWSCEMEIGKGKTYKQEWIVSDDKMFAPKGKGNFLVTRNDSDVFFAFYRWWAKDRKDPVPKNNYVMIVKSTGMAIEFDDVSGGIINFGMDPEGWVGPLVRIGSCLETVIPWTAPSPTSVPSAQRAAAPAFPTEWQGNDKWCLQSDMPNELIFTRRDQCYLTDHITLTADRFERKKVVCRLLSGNEGKHPRGRIYQAAMSCQGEHERWFERADFYTPYPADARFAVARSTIKIGELGRLPDGFNDKRALK
jgi:hypothetical protein